MLDLQRKSIEVLIGLGTAVLSLIGLTPWWSDPVVV